VKGSVRRRGKVWQYRFDIDPDPLTGERQQASRSGFRTEKEATKALREAMSAYEKGRLVRKSALTVGAFLNEWHAAVKPSLRASTWVNYRDYMDAYVLPFIGKSRVQDITPVRLNLLYSHLLEQGRKRGRSDVAMYQRWRVARLRGKEPTAKELAEAGGVGYDAGRKALRRYRSGHVPSAEAGLAPKTVQNVHRMMHRALRDAVRWDYLPRNVAEDAEPPKRRRTRPQVWTPEQLRAFIRHVRNDRYFALWLLATTTGLRRGELAGLRRTDVDLELGRISPSLPRVVVDGKAENSEPKTYSGYRVIALDPVTLEALREHIARWEEERLQFGHDSEMLFAWPNGKPIHPDTITQWFAAHVRAANLPRLRLHDVRHSYASAALKTGVHPKVVSARLGHASVAFTLSVYSHVMPGMDEHAASTIADLILGPPDGAAPADNGPGVHKSVHPSSATPLDGTTEPAAEPFAEGGSG
jgi:integrase